LEGVLEGVKVKGLSIARAFGGEGGRGVDLDLMEGIQL